jgi:hypothetical protein
MVVALSTDKMIVLVDNYTVLVVVAGKSRVAVVV